MIKKYADLLNLLDHKEVFSYKTSVNSGQIAGTTNYNVGGGSSSISGGGFNSSGMGSSSLLSGNQSSSNHNHHQQQNQLTSLSQSSLLRNPSSVGSNRGDCSEDNVTWIFQKFKQSFYDLVYKFPHANYLKVINDF